MLRVGLTVALALFLFAARARSKTYDVAVWIPADSSLESIGRSFALAANEINEFNVLGDGDKLSLRVSRSSELWCDVPAFSRAISNLPRNITAMLSFACSDAIVATQAAVRARKLPIVEVWASSDRMSLRANYPYFIRTIGADSFQARALVATISYFGGQAVVRLCNSTAGGGHIDVVVSALLDDGFSALELIRERRAHVVVVFAERTPTLLALTDALFARNMFGREYVFVFCDELDESFFSYIGPLTSSQHSAFEERKRVLQGALAVRHSLGPADSVELEHFVRSFEEEYGDSPRRWSSQAYDAVYLLAFAVAKCKERDEGAVTPECLMDKMHSADFFGASGHVTFRNQSTNDRDSQQMELYNTQGIRFAHVGSLYEHAGGAIDVHLTLLATDGSSASGSRIIWPDGDERAPTFRTIRVGVLATGAAVLGGESEDVAIRAALERVNDEGLLSGSDIFAPTFVTDTCRADVARAAVEQFVRMRAEVVLGAHCSTTALVAAPLLQRANIPLISQAATAESLSDRRAFPLFFRTVASDVASAERIMDIVKAAGWGRIGIVASSDEFGQQGVRQLNEQAHAAGVSVAAWYLLQWEPRCDVALHNASLRTLFVTRRVRIIALYVAAEASSCALQSLRAASMFGPRSGTTLVLSYFPDLLSEPSAERRKQEAEVLAGSLGVVGWTGSPQRQAAWDQMFYHFARANHSSQFAPFAYDAALIAARGIALQKQLQAALQLASTSLDPHSGGDATSPRGTVTLGQALQQAVLPSGVTGPVAFDGANRIDQPFQYVSFGKDFAMTAIGDSRAKVSLFGLPWPNTGGLVPLACQSGTRGEYIYNGSVAVATKCFPCPAGTSAAFNELECAPCADRSRCPFGSSVPLVDTLSVPLAQSQAPVTPGPLVSPRQIENLWWTYFAIALTLVTVVTLGPTLIATACCIKQERLRETLANADMFPLAHPVEYGEAPRKRRTATGGQASMVLAIIAVTLICFLVHRYALDRLEVVQSSTDDVLRNAPTGPLIIDFVVLGMDRRWACEKDCQFALASAAGDGDGLASLGLKTTCNLTHNTCRVRTTIGRPQYSAAAIKLDYSLPGTRAHAIGWEVRSQIGPHDFRVRDGLVAPNNSVIWGSQRGEVVVGVRFTRIETFESTTWWGAMPYFLSQRLGATANATTYFSGNATSGVSWQLSLVVSDSVQVLTFRERLSLLEMFAEIFALLAAAVKLVHMAMRGVEQGQFWREKRVLKRTRLTTGDSAAATGDDSSDIGGDFHSISDVGWLAETGSLNGRSTSSASLSPLSDSDSKRHHAGVSLLNIQQSGRTTSSSVVQNGSSSPVLTARSAGSELPTRSLVVRNF